eukprot:1176084-Prorocentrum_minimum.AAC.2
MDPNELPVFSVKGDGGYELEPSARDLGHTIRAHTLIARSEPHDRSAHLQRKLWVARPAARVRTQHSALGVFVVCMGRAVAEC